MSTKCCYKNNVTWSQIKLIFGVLSILFVVCIAGYTIYCDGFDSGRREGYVNGSAFGKKQICRELWDKEKHSVCNE